MYIDGGIKLTSGEVKLYGTSSPGKCGGFKTGKSVEITGGTLEASAEASWFHQSCGATIEGTSSTLTMSGGNVYLHSGEARYTDTTISAIYNTGLEVASTFNFTGGNLTVEGNKAYGTATSYGMYSHGQFNMSGDALLNISGANSVSGSVVGLYSNFGGTAINMSGGTLNVENGDTGASSTSYFNRAIGLYTSSSSSSNFEMSGGTVTAKSGSANNISYESGMNNVGIQALLCKNFTLYGGNVYLYAGSAALATSVGLFC